MTKQDIQFQIDQLRKDKIIYAVEATATSVTALVAIFAFVIVNMVYEAGYISLIAILYWAFVMITNGIRLRKIRKLELLLKE